MLEVAHALHLPLSRVEQMSPDEIGLHYAFLIVKSEDEREAYEKAKKAGRGDMKPVVQFSRR